MNNPRDDDEFTVYDKSGGEYTVQRVLGGLQLEDGTPVEQINDAQFLIRSDPPIPVEIEHYIDTDLDEED